MIVRGTSEWRAVVNTCLLMQCGRPLEEVLVHLV